MELEREPCPKRIVTDIGSAFAMGFVGGNIWYFVKGLRQGARGQKWATGITAAKMRGPIIGGNFALWMTCYSSFDCTFSYLRGKDDALNSIASGFVTGGVLAIRGGVRVACISAIAGGVVLTFIEGLAHIVPYMARKAFPEQQQQPLH
eukprot:TRINITY_DN13239_c0_g1_i1.p1 TRINITY_DN13239_c0_g1~~TRINITY_DN13239_c0_g1_i1.p1  ORF type:complete len:148 (-),score=18.78 TRINITY_DN13239_c0_g1_i1:14-457(-)